MGKSYSNMSRAQLEKLARSQAGKLAHASRNGGVAPKSQPKPRKAAQKWLNVAGHICTSEGTARYSSRVIGRHLRDACGCDAVKGFRCKAVKKYGYDYSTLGKDPKAQLDFASKFSG